MPQKNPEIDSSLERRLMLRQKALLTRIVLPAMLITSIFLMLTHWGFDEKSFWGFGILVALVIFNVLLSMKNYSIKTPWGRSIESRSDEMDTLRWCINLPLDIFLVWSLSLHVAAAVAIWLLLTFAALTDIQQRKNKLIVTAATFVCFCFLMIFYYQIDLKTQIYLISCYAALVFVLWKLESYVVREMMSVFNEKLQRKRVENEALELQREAAIGHSTRAISHEMNTLISTALFSTEKLRNSPSPDGIELDRLEKALAYMAKVSTLVLDDLGKQDSPKRIISLAQLQEDIQLLLCRNSSQCLTASKINFPPNAESYLFEERTGSTYLIIHNLVKNAHEAIVEKYGNKSGGIIKIIAKITGGTISISVYDNGIGLSPQQARNIQSGKFVTTKANGHGLGLLFVKKECKKNNFQFDIDSLKKDYSCITINFKN